LGLILPEGTQVGLQNSISIGVGDYNPNDQFLSNNKRTPLGIIAPVGKEIKEA